MQKVYSQNGLVVRTEKEIKLRQYFEEVIVSSLKDELKKINTAFEFIKVEVSQITPNELINK